MKTIFIVSRNADFTASRLMTESALTSQGYIDEGIYEVFDITTSESLGKMNATQVIQRIKQNENAYKINEMNGKSESANEPKTWYVSARPLYN